MTSRTSCFDRTIFLHELRRTAPLWALYSLLLLLLPLNLIASFDPQRTNHSASILTEYANAFSSLAPSVYGAALAWVLHGSLFRCVPTNFYAALPLRRETLFLTRWLTGLLTALVPNLAAALLALAVTSAIGLPLPLDCFRFFAAAALGFLFFYGLGTLCCMVSGHAAMMPILYLILNFVVIVVEMIVQVLLESFVYGMPLLSRNPLVVFSPLYFMLFDRYSLDTSYHDSFSWHYLIVLAALGVVFSVLALLLFRRRDMERSGDVITVRWLRPVFQYAFTLGCALVFCQIVKSLFSISRFSYNFYAVMALLLFGAFIGHIAARMMLTKSVRVFRGGWLSFAICCAVLLLSFGAVRLDLFGYSRRIPAADEVKSVCLQTYDGMQHPLETPEAISDVLALHERFVREREDLSAMSNTRRVYLLYALKNGKTFCRRFPLPTDLTQPGSITYAFDQVYNSAPFVLARTVPAGLRETAMLSCTIQYSLYPDEPEDTTLPNAAAAYYSGDRTLGSREAWELYTTAVLPDLEDSSLGRSQFPLYSNDTQTEGYDITLYFDYYADPEAPIEERSPEIFHVSLTADASRTIAYLQALGYPVA